MAHNELSQTPTRNLNTISQSKTAARQVISSPKCVVRIERQMIGTSKTLTLLSHYLQHLLMSGLLTGSIYRQISTYLSSVELWFRVLTIIFVKCNHNLDHLWIGTVGRVVRFV